MEERGYGEGHRKRGYKTQKARIWGTANGVSKLKKFASTKQAKLTCKNESDNCLLGHAGGSRKKINDRLVGIATACAV